MHNLPDFFGNNEVMRKQCSRNSERIVKISELLNNNDDDIYDNYDVFCELHKIMYDEKRVFPHYDPKQRVIDAINSLTEIKDLFGKFESYLDIGCGMGATSRAAFEMGCSKSFGIDMVESPHWQQYCVDTKGMLQYLCCDINHLNFDYKFDLITSYSAFEHFSDPQNILDNIVRLLDDNGMFYTKFFPIYYNQDGMHLYREIAIPWFHLIFSDRVISKFLNTSSIEDFLVSSNIFPLNKYTGFDFLYLFSSHEKLRIKKIDLRWNTDMYWFADIFRKYLPYSPQDLYLRGFTIAMEKVN